MDQNRPMTKRERKDAKRLERLAAANSGGQANILKWIIIVGGAALFIGLFGLAVFFIKQSQNKPIVLSSAGWVRGTGKVTLVEFGDFECPACRAYEPFVRSASKDFKGKMKLVFKHFPLTSVHPNAMLGARAAEAGGVQGKFWEMHDTLYDNQEKWGELPAADSKDAILGFAKGLGLNMDKFKKDLDQSNLDSKITGMENEGISLGVSATPTFYLDNKKIENNPQNYEDFKKLIAEEIKRVGSKN